MPVCGSCGSHVTDQFARVFGDNTDDVDACINCRDRTDARDSNFAANPGGSA